MKKIIPFNNILEFNTDVREITAISLEHEISKYPDMISGVFYISGEYKITEGLLDKEKFNFELPFDIALSNNYELDSLLVDIDDFRYDLVSDKNLKVNIDLYIDGNEILEPVKEDKQEPTRDILEHNEDLTNDILSEMTKEEIRYDEEITEELLDNEKKVSEESHNEEIYDSEIYNEDNPIPIEIKSIPEEDIKEIEPERIDLLKDMLTNNKENTMNEEPNININNNNENENKNINNNLFMPNQEEEKYVTYRVYKVLETDSLDSILTKYNITKEMLADYNNIENITPGDKLIIPTNEK